MHYKTFVSRVIMATLIGGAGLVTASVFTGPSSYVLAADANGQNAQLKLDVQKELRGKNFKNVSVRVNNGTVTLSGQVDLYAYKQEAIKKAQKVRGARDVRDNIAVGGPIIPDDVLWKKLNDRIQVDRIGFGQVFDAILVQVRNGVVTLGGHAKGPVTEQSAVAIADYMPGVKGVIDKIQIDPVSPMDDGVRMAAFAAIYGYAPLKEYAIVPSRPIRISVQNQNITLYGTVNNTMDKELVYMRVMQLPNVFHVTNNLMVENQTSEQKTNKVSTSQK